MLKSYDIFIQICGLVILIIVVGLVAEYFNSSSSSIKKVLSTSIITIVVVFFILFLAAMVFPKALCDFHSSIHVDQLGMKPKKGCVTLELDDLKRIIMDYYDVVLGEEYSELDGMIEYPLDRFHEDLNANSLTMIDSLKKYREEHDNISVELDLEVINDKKNRDGYYEVTFYKDSRAWNNVNNVQENFRIKELMKIRQNGKIFFIHEVEQKAIE